jgi:hypothetical protein
MHESPFSDVVVSVLQLCGQRTYAIISWSNGHSLMTLFANTQGPIDISFLFIVDLVHVVWSYQCLAGWHIVLCQGQLLLDILVNCASPGNGCMRCRLCYTRLAADGVSQQWTLSYKQLVESTNCFLPVCWLLLGYPDASPTLASSVDHTHFGPVLCLAPRPMTPAMACLPIGGWLMRTYLPKRPLSMA